MSAGTILRDLRIKKGVSQGIVASDIGITKSSWAMYERGERVPRDEVKVKIAQYFNLSVQEIFFNHIEH